MRSHCRDRQAGKGSGGPCLCRRPRLPSFPARPSRRNGEADATLSVCRELVASGARLDRRSHDAIEIAANRSVKPSAGEFSHQGINRYGLETTPPRKSRLMIGRRRGGKGCYGFASYTGRACRSSCDLRTGDGEFALKFCAWCWRSLNEKPDQIRPLQKSVRVQVKHGRI